MTDRKPPPSSRDARFMAWLQRKNAEYAPVIFPAGVLGLAISFGLNRPAFGTVFGMLLVASLTTGRPK